MGGFGLRGLLPALCAALEGDLAGASIASLDNRAARLVGAGGRGMVLKTLSRRVSEMKKPPRTLGGFFDGKAVKFQQDAFIMHNLRYL